MFKNFLRWAIPIGSAAFAFMSSVSDQKQEDRINYLEEAIAELQKGKDSNEETEDIEEN